MSSAEVQLNSLTTWSVSTREPRDPNPNNMDPPVLQCSSVKLCEQWRLDWVVLVMLPAGLVSRGPARAMEAGLGC
jgi:hypothetical protein